MNARTPALAGTEASTSLFAVEGLRCAGCIAKLENGLAGVAGVHAARVNFTTRRVSIAHDAGLDADALQAAIAQLGFTAEPFRGEASNPVDPESRTLLKALGVAGFAAINILLLSVSVWSGAEGSVRSLFHWLSAAIALPAIAYAGRPFFTSAWGALRVGRTNMDVPISIGVVLTCGVSLYETIIHGPHAYFDGATMLLFFLLAGRFLDSAMRARATDSVAALLRQSAPGGHVLAKDGSTSWRAAAELAPGMRLLVASGERFAADGIVESGTSSVDRALITGENAPVAVAPSDTVLAGTINLDAPLTVRITAAEADTVIADIARMMTSATQAKSLYVRVADRAARLYAPAVHSLAALSFLGWMLAGAGWHESLLIAVAVLIITCPCALGLAVPISQVVASGALMRVGVLIKDGSALERLATVDAVLLDKTGTLTLGRPIPVGTLPLGALERAAARALAQASRHPLARALAAALTAEGIVAAPVSDLDEQPGLGISGIIDGQPARLGRPDWVGAAASGDTLLTAFRLGDAPVRLLAFHDGLRPDAPAVIARLAALGLPATILSGDRPQAVASIAGALGIAAHAELQPGDKLARINSLQAQGRHVLMVGDGLNDGPALKAAHVSMAPSSASDVGKTAADLIFLGDRLMPVAQAITVARRTMAVVRQNFVLAIGYNVLAVPLAIGGQVTPLVAALAMSGSSLIVVANALRLRTAARSKTL
ncbi:copper-translocating P-type ATPase [Polymorphobacter multimanifer]|uniref:heavy metal translocating P-type ATPase n=1 Tax=Polymorphobacter multimanifer TaxID=1070431 RepID=UPI00166C7AD7|nr:heavy metal translocating P-type ATPase [Polymorphobacter multimanifer]GGI72280.1 copper-translocating P-type ATPase [Polymorphobacter multimanifer]